MNKIFISIFVALLLVSAVSAANWYVSTTSSGTASGNSWTNKIALSSLNWANVQPGDTVYIDGGSTGMTYNMQLNPTKSGTAANPITITRGVETGHNGVPTFTRNTYRTGWFSNDYLIIQYLNFTSTGGGGYEVIEIDGDYVTFQYNTVLNPISKAVRLDSNTGVKILHNTFDTGTSNPSGAGPDGMWIGNNGRNLEVAYNKILMRNSDPNNGNHKDVIQSYGWQADATGGTTKIHHNFFYNAEPTGTSNTILELGGIGGNWQIYNNIIVYGGQGSGRAIGMGNCGEAPYDGYNFNAEIYNNIIYNVNPEYYGTMIDNTNSLIFKNNIIYNPGGPYHTLGLGTVTTAHTMNIDYNQYTKAASDGVAYIFVCNGNANSYSWSSWRSTFGQDAHSEFFTSNTAMRFAGTSFPSINPADYALLNTSSGVNEGTTISLFNDDYNGNLRTAPWDVGAFEYGAGSAPTCNPADSNCDNCISLGEISTYVGQWLQGSVTLSQCSAAVSSWLGGC